MKNVKLPILGLSLILIVASCKKDDFKDSSTDTTGAILASNADSLSWIAASQWQKSDQETFSVHYFTIADSSITADVADNGLVLVFKKAGNNINTLPFEEASTNEGGNVTSTNANYWYHQVSEGSLLISYDVYKAPVNPDNANSFQYFVITPEKLESLQNNGYTAEKLMNLNYKEAAALLKSTD
jgi:hypothetical protein